MRRRGVGQRRHLVVLAVTSLGAVCWAAVVVSWALESPALALTVGAEGLHLLPLFGRQLATNG